MGKRYIPKCELCGKQKRKDVLMAHFPIEVSRCRQWLAATGKTSLLRLSVYKLNQLKYLCGDHFPLSMYCKNRKYLTRTAVPTINISTHTIPDRLLQQFSESNYDGSENYEVDTRSKYRTTSDVTQYEEDDGAQEVSTAQEQYLISVYVTEEESNDGCVRSEIQSQYQLSVTALENDGDSSEDEEVNSDSQYIAVLDDDQSNDSSDNDEVNSQKRDVGRLADQKYENSQKYDNEICSKSLAIVSDGGVPSTSRVNNPTDECKSKPRKHSAKVRKLMQKLKNTRKALESVVKSSVNIYDTKCDTFQTMVKHSMENECKTSRARRWNMESKVVAFSIFKRSPAVYKILSEHIAMPSMRSMYRILKGAPMDSETL